VAAGSSLLLGTVGGGIVFNTAIGSAPAGATGATFIVDSLSDMTADPTRCTDLTADNCT